MTKHFENLKNLKWSDGLRLASVTVFLTTLLLLCGAALAQTPGAEGIDNGGYHYQGSFEFGYRFMNNLGSTPTYDTFVNEQQGPRLLKQTLNIRSLNHESTLFDNLDMSSFGWGGDPNNSARLRMSKNKWYNFNATFRRDRNFFDYNSLANPLNAPNPYISVDNSPHEFETVRRMYDYNLTLMPQSGVRFRLGYSRNSNAGPAFSSDHQGTDTVLFQNTRNLLNAYQVGVDVRLLPRTSISYDQFLQYYKGDSTWTDQNLVFQLAGGTPVDPGISYNPTASQPCSAPVVGATTPPTLSPACNGFFYYDRWAPVRVSYPTEQLTLQSRYFRNLDLTGRVSYSSSKSDISNWFENFSGLATRTREADGLVSGPASSKRVIGSADFGATIHITEKLRFVDSFRFTNFRIPGMWNLTTSQLFAATLATTPNIFDPATCPAPYTAATCPQHSASSGADLTNDQRYNFLRQDGKLNTFEIEYDFTQRLSGHIGYRYDVREVNNNFYDFQNLTFYPSLATRGPCANVTLINGICYTTATSNNNETVNIHANSLLAGLSARPTDNLRASFDLEMFSADNALTRISPRNLQHYKARVSYKPKAWVDMAGTVNALESRDNIPEVLHREHNRNYGFSTTFTPKQKFALDLGYNYDDVFSTTSICYLLGNTPPANSTLCSGGAPYFSATSLYSEKVNFVYGNVHFQLAPKVAANAGYALTSTSGLTPTLADPTLLTSLGYNYHKPMASLDVNLAKGLTWKTGWVYYDYNEKYLSTPLPPRDFQSNQVTLAMRYEF